MQWAFKWLIVLLFVFGIWFFAFSPNKQEHLTKLVDTLNSFVEEERSNEQESKLQAAELDDIGDECASAPPKHGQAVLLTDSSIQSKLHSRFYVVNEHIYPLLITFSNFQDGEDVGAVYLHASQNKQINLPVGEYLLKVQSGREWCNFNLGFVDNEDIYSEDQIIKIEANRVANLRVMAYGNMPADVMLSFSNTLGLVQSSNADGQHQVQGSGSLVLQRVVGGHYAVNGSINGLPAHFLVDTGATYVAIPESFAKRAGITECIKEQMMTANGIAATCRATASELTIGQFTLKNVRVGYSKGLGNTFLLGMNVIGLFKMEQQGDVMKLTR